MRELTPRDLVLELDKYIVGQNDAKRAVAVAVRNRWRRQRLPEDLQQDVAPKNILMVGPTGVGKTEIARRLAKLTGAPFIKVEATKFTEVGYVGRDCESMVRELVENAIVLVKQRERDRVRERAEARVEDRLVELLMPGAPGYKPPEGEHERVERSKEKLRTMLASGAFEQRKVEVSVERKASPMVLSNLGGMEQLDGNLQDMFEKLMPKQTVRREMTVADARKVLFDQECEALINPDNVSGEAVRLAENLGIIFLDEIDKIATSEGPRGGADVSRQGVQRDLLPIVEGTTVQTKHGPVRTDHVLFIAAGAFSRARPADLMPELQGRFPIRVELQDLTRDDFVRILTEPKHSLTRQSSALLETEGVELIFTREGVDALADYAYRLNQTTQNIGARRLYAMLERVLEELSYAAPDMGGGKVEITAEYVKDRLDAISKDEDLSRFIL